jgi:hypothetical protein
MKAAQSRWGIGRFAIAMFWSKTVCGFSIHVCRVMKSRGASML